MPESSEGYLSSIKQWCKRNLGFILLFFYVLILCVAGPLSIKELVRHHAERHVVVWFVAGVFVYVTIPITVAGIVQHTKNFSDPPQQKRLIRIMMMVPVYSFFSYLGMILKDKVIYLDSLRECYESYVIYNFMMFLVTFMYEHYNVEQLLTYKPAQPQLWPFQRLPPWPRGKSFVIWAKRGVFVYVIAKPLTTFLTLVFTLAGKSGKGEISLGSVWFWTLIVDNFSQAWALYCLVIFYKALKYELAPLKPLPKFLCVKAVVFFSFWQGFFLELLVLFKIIKDSKDPDGYSAEDVASTAQNMLICIEMFGFSIAHIFVFSHKPYETDDDLPPTQFFSTLSDVFDIRDVGNDIRAQLGMSVREMRDRSSGRAPGDGERMPLLFHPGSTSEHVELETIKDYTSNHSSENVS